MYSDYNDTEEIVDGELIGQRLHFNSKTGAVTLAKMSVTLGQTGLIVEPLPETSRYGFVRYENNVPVEWDLHNWLDLPPKWGPAPDDWAHYTSCVGVVDGQLVTLTSSLGLRSTLRNVIGQWKARGRLVVPKCWISTVPRNDGRGNIDFNLNFGKDDWVDVADHARMFPGLVRAPRAASLTGPGVTPATLIDAAAKIDAMVKGGATKAKIDIRSGKGAWMDEPPARPMPPEDESCYAGPGPDDEIIHDLT